MKIYLRLALNNENTVSKRIVFVAGLWWGRARGIRTLSVLIMAILNHSSVSI